MPQSKQPVVKINKNNKPKSKKSAKEELKCVFCGEAAVFKCLRCLDPYCSMSCQQNDWYYHQFVCFAIPKLVPITMESSLTKNTRELWQRECRERGVYGSRKRMLELESKEVQESKIQSTLPSSKKYELCYNTAKSNHIIEKEVLIESNSNKMVKNNVQNKLKTNTQIARTEMSGESRLTTVKDVEKLAGFFVSETHKMLNELGSKRKKAFYCQLRKMKGFNGSLFQMLDSINMVKPINFAYDLNGILKLMTEKNAVIPNRCVTDNYTNINQNMRGETTAFHEVPEYQALMKLPERNEFKSRQQMQTSNSLITIQKDGLCNSVGSSKNKTTKTSDQDLKQFYTEQFLQKFDEKYLPEKEEPWEEHGFLRNHEK